MSERVIGAMVALAAIILTLIMLAVIELHSEQVRPTSYEITKFEGEMLVIEHRAIDQAFENSITSVFAIWMKDPTGQPARAINGVVNARRAYVAAKTRLEERDAEYRRTVGDR